jgi:hypothetical protein
MLQIVGGKTTGNRANNSRAKEFDLLFGFLSKPKMLQDVITDNPSGTNCQLEGIHFEFGNVKRLAIELDKTTPTRPFPISPAYVFHIDSVPAGRKRQIEKQFSLATGSVSDPQTKVDVLIVDRRNQPYFVSFKDDAKPSKLGQVSRKTVYGKTYLDGGIDEIQFPSIQSSLFLSHHDTNLTKDQFEKLSQKNKELAAFKHQHPEAWGILVQQRMATAVDELKQFGQVLKSHRPSLIEFIGQTLAGNLRNSSDFYLLIGSKVVRFSEALERLQDKSFSLTTSLHTTANKTSLILSIETPLLTYGLTKIEPAFDGYGSAVSQTKGIIYYFQQYPNSGNSYKKLLLDICQ